MSRNVRDVMTENPITIDAAEPVSSAALLLRDHDIGSLPVTQEGALYGMITDRDITTRLGAEGIELESGSVRDVASTDAITVSPETDLDEALRLMAHHQVRRLPVVEGDRVVGILAQADIAHEEEHEQVGKTVEAISDPSTEDRR